MRKESKKKKKTIGNGIPTVPPRDNGKHPGGRPGYDKEWVLAEGKKYLEECIDSFEQLVKQSNPEKGYEMYENQLTVRLPSIAGLALRLGIVKDTLYAWAREDEEFSDFVKEVMLVQERKLTENGLSGRYNPTIAKLILSTHHGYVEKSDTTHHIGLADLLDKAAQRRIA